MGYDVSLVPIEGQRMESPKSDMSPEPGEKQAKRPRKRAQNLYGQSMGRKGMETRERLIRATVDLLERRSIRDVSVSDIATLAGTASSRFYIHFPAGASAALAAASNVGQST